jgi:hypothetical protein
MIRLWKSILRFKWGATWVAMALSVKLEQEENYSFFEMYTLGLIHWR